MISRRRKCRLESEILQLFFCERALREIDVLQGKRLRAPATHVMEVDEKGNVVISKVQSPPGPTSSRESFWHEKVRLFERTV